MGRRWERLPDEKRRLIIKLAAQGCSYRQIADQAQVAQGSVGRVVRPLGGVIRAELVEVPACRLSLDDRIEIKLGLERGETFEVIGARIGRHRSAVSREIKAAKRGRDGYRPTEAHALAVQRWKRHKDTKLALNPVLCQRVVDGLERLWSPQQIARRLRVEFGDDRSMHISHETIYQSLYVQGRGELRRELARCLRTGRAHAPAPRWQRRSRARSPDMVMISERPAEVADRAVPGHWEGDLIIGRNGKSAIGTLVERSTRFVLLLHLPDGRDADQVREAMTAKIATLPEALRRSITWDQGHEMADHAQFSDRHRHRRSTSAIPTRHGNAVPTRTPTDCSANTSPKAPTCRSTTPRSSPPSRTAQRKTSTNPRLDDTIRETQRAPWCNDRLRTPRISAAQAGDRARDFGSRRRIPAPTPLCEKLGQVAAEARLSIPRNAMLAACCSRNHWYVSRTPVSRSIFGFHPVVARRLTSNILRGVPSGFEVSKRNSAAGYTSLGSSRQARESTGQHRYRH